jgi:hypothetical protein
MTPTQLAWGLLVVGLILIVAILVGGAKNWFPQYVGAAMAVPASVCLSYAYDTLVAPKITEGGYEGGGKGVLEALMSAFRGNKVSPEDVSRKTCARKSSKQLRVLSDEERVARIDAYSKHKAELMNIHSPEQLKKIIDFPQPIIDDFMDVLMGNVAQESLEFLIDLKKFRSLEPSSPEYVQQLKKMLLYFDNDSFKIDDATGKFISLPDNPLECQTDINIHGTDKKALQESILKKLVQAGVEIPEPNKLVKPYFTENTPDIETMGTVWNNTETSVVTVMIPDYHKFRTQVVSKAEIIMPRRTHRTAFDAYTNKVATGDFSTEVTKF